MKKVFIFLLAVLLVVGFSGCGKQGKTTKKGGVQLRSEGDFPLDGLQIVFGEKTPAAICRGEQLFEQNGRITDMLGEDVTAESGKMTVCGVGVGNTLEEIIRAFDLKPGQAAFDYEYDPYGDGCTDVGDEIYNGTIPDAEKMSALDITINLYYHFENGAWQLIDQTVNSPDEFEDVLTVRFSTEGVHDLYGQEQGRAFLVACKLSDGEE